MEINKKNWKEDHLQRKHLENYDWCPLCIARKKGEINSSIHLVPPNQDINVNIKDEIRTKDVGPGG